MEGGFALLAVLTGMAVLAMLAAAIGAVVSGQVRAAHALAEAARAEAVADGGVRLMMERLRQTPETQAVTLAVEDCTVEVAAADEGGKVDLNAADDDLLRALLAGAGVAGPDRLADAIRDWTDADDLKRLNGAEAREYRAAGRPPPANRPFAAAEELRRVLGVTPDLAARLAPLVTIHARQRGIDPGVAPPELVTLLRGSGLRVPPAFVLGSRRQAFTIRAVARTPAGAVFVREAVVRVTRDPLRPATILAWRRGRV